MKKMFFSLIALFHTSIWATSDLKFGLSRKPTSETIQISFIGDILIHDDLYLKVFSSKSKDFSQLWPQIIPFIEKADFSYGNLEGPVALGINNKGKDVGDLGFTYDKIVYSGTNFLFNYHPRIIDDLKKSGIDIVSTANNHTFDRSSLGIDRTIDALNEKNMMFIGTRKKNTTDEFYKISKIKNFNIAWISCTEALNGFIDKYSQTLLCYEQSSEVLRLISLLKDKADVDAIIVTPHWGIEYKHEINKQQKKHAELFLEAGATAVIGSHPHVLQPAQKYITKDGRETFVAYSLGNFAAFQRDIDRKASAVIYLDFSKELNGKAWISNYSYEPTLRASTEIFPARNNPAAVKHIEQYLGPLK
jgi:2',3'-cyclic-nucleotide 2'-phosphodiesterase (5'-nucleotidase family)